MRIVLHCRNSLQIVTDSVFRHLSNNESNYPSIANRIYYFEKYLNNRFLVSCITFSNSKKIVRKKNRNGDSSF